jgi:hypothetical protein
MLQAHPPFRASQTSRDAVELFDRMLDTKLGQYPRLLRQLAGEVGAERPDGFCDIGLG